MTSSREAGVHGDPLSVIEGEIRELFTSDAEQIVTALGDESMVVVTGPWGNGKTQNLIPAVQNLLRQDGRSVVKIEGQVYAHLSDELPELLGETPNPTRGVAIVDEAGHYRTREAKAALLTAARDHGFTTVIPVIAYDIDTDAHQREAADWREAGAAVSRKAANEIPTVHLPAKEVPIDLARRFLTARGAFFSTPPEAIDYALSFLPRNLRVLNTIAGERSLESTQRTIVANAQNWQGAVPRTRIGDIEQRVRADMARAGR